MNLEVGDWVKSYSAGIWRIYRIAHYKCSDPATGKEQEKTTVFSKRFLSNSYKRSFKEESCDPAFVTKLDSGEQMILEEFVKMNESLYQKFNGYEPKEISSVYNARVCIPENESPEDLNAKLEGTGFIRGTEIRELLTQLGYDTGAGPAWTVQFVSENFHCMDGYLVYKYSRVLEF